MPEPRWVLVAEDDDNDFTLIQRSVNKLQLDVELRRGRNGLEGMEVLKASAALPVLALLDVKMPKVSGLEMLRSIREDSVTRFLPVVMLTSSDEPADLTEAYELGCNAYVRKPILYGEFVATLHQIFAFWMTVRVPGEN